MTIKDESDSLSNKIISRRAFIKALLGFGVIGVITQVMPKAEAFNNNKTNNRIEFHQQGNNIAVYVDGERKFVLGNDGTLYTKRIQMVNNLDEVV
jgi:hypothetical protein